MIIVDKMDGVAIFGAVVGTIVVLIVFFSIVFSHLQEKSKQFVRVNSKKIKKLIELNDGTKFYKGAQRDYLIDFTLSSRREYSEFQWVKRIDEYIIEHKSEIKRHLLQSDSNKSIKNEYLKQVKIVKESKSIIPKKMPFYLSKLKYIKIEDEIIRNLVLDTSTGLSYTIRWSYTTPAGRNHYEDKVKYSEKSIKERYLKIFYLTEEEFYRENERRTKRFASEIIDTKNEQSTPNSVRVNEGNKNEVVEPFSNKSEKPMIDNASEYIEKAQDNVQKENASSDLFLSEDEILIKKLSTELTNDAYSLKQVKDYLKSNNVKPTDSNISYLLYAANLKKQKRVDVYVKSKFGTVDQLILESADDNGVITYNNFIKNNEYDYAIERLCKQRRIIPYSNMTFLKFDSAISFDGLNASDINYFDFLVKNLSSTTKYISVKYVVNHIKCKITEKEQDEVFIYSLLKYNRFLSEVTSIKGLFTFTDKKDRFNFLLYLIGDKRSVDAFEMIYNIKEEYGVEYNIYSITYDIDKSKSDIYYNEETEKIYRNKEIFFEEVL